MGSPPTVYRGCILVVDDSPEFLQLVSSLFRREGFLVTEAADGTTALAAVDDHRPDLVVLDLTLPDLDGMEVCRRIRERSDCYIIMLTGRGDEVDRVMGLRSGADDYVVKPFSPRELAARAEVILRRSRVGGAPEHRPEGDGRRRFQDLVVDPLAHEVLVEGEPVTLTRIEFQILDALSKRPRMVHSRTLLRDLVWGSDWYGDDHVVDVHIANLRKKIDRRDGPSHIRTVRGVGYRMDV